MDPNVPGPKLAALTTLWQTYAVYQGDLSVRLHALHAKYAHDIGQIYGYKGKFIKGPFYRGWALFGTGHFSERNEEKHRIARNRIASIYSLNNILLLESQCDTCSSVLFQKLDELAEKSAITDVSGILAAYAYDCMARLGFGETLGFLSDEMKAKNAIYELSKAQRTMVILGTMTTINWFSSFRPIVKIVLKLLGRKGPALFLTYAQTYVQERMRLRTDDPFRYEQHKDLLNQFLEHGHTGNDLIRGNGITMGKELSIQEIIKNCIALFMAGADTTSATMIAFLRFVYAHPPSLVSLRKEIDDAVREGRITLPLSYSGSKTLPFYNACLKEAMRLNPVIGMPLQRVVPKGGFQIDGDFYPEGTCIGMVPQEVHTDPSIFGDDANTWNPNRWLSGNKNELERYNLTLKPGYGLGNILVYLIALLFKIIARETISTAEYIAPGEIRGTWLPRALPIRTGRRPTITWFPVPHRQINQLASTVQTEKINQTLRNVLEEKEAMVELRRSEHETHLQGLFVKKEVLASNEGPIKTRRECYGEIAHIHSGFDFSFHVILSPQDCKQVIDKGEGWGERHSCSGRLKGLPKEYLLIYAPRTQTELDVVTDIVRAGADFLSGQPACEV
ncbi:hypothetical protein Clacol_001053 [Clathrus columnatus]|uniref:Luciferase domain-containing protein n=1 Tax=Clathrus columnatus TaxID=1419009 RepID=A0AAV4ZXL2_9AGAM|nr:hypothetical protein Clacol_001053 [Clathrus columnatus]